MRYPFSCIGLFAALLSCHRTNPEIKPTPITVTALFVGKQPDGCRLPVIELEQGLAQARQLIPAQWGASYTGYFSVLNLPDAYWQAGRRLQMRVQASNESVVCDAKGQHFPLIDVVTVE